LQAAAWVRHPAALPRCSAAARTLSTEWDTAARQLQQVTGP